MPEVPFSQLRICWNIGITTLETAAAPIHFRTCLETQKPKERSKREFFRFLTKEKKLGVYTLCNKAAISYETYRSIRKNRNKDIYIRTLLILLRTLGVSAEEFFSDPAFSSEELDIDFK